MLKKILSATLMNLLILTSCFAQTTSPNPADSKTPKLTRADFYRVQPVEGDFEKELYKSPTKRNNFSSAAKTALWIGLVAAGVITVVVLATRNNDKENNSPCSIGTAQIGVPCPPGCVCIQ